MSVLILGATSRIARELANRYAERGQAVFVAARDADEAERIAADLRVRHGVRAVAGAFDATDFDGHPQFVARVAAAVGDVDVAVAAFGDMGEGGDGDFRAARQVIDVNFTGAASICEALAAHMAPRRAGCIIGISSVAGDRGRQSNYVYGSAKGGFTLYLQGLRNRLFKQGVHVMTVKLGFVDTRMTFGMETGIPIASPEQVSRAIVRAADKRVDAFYYPHFWRGIMTVIRAIPEKAFKRLSL
jgi:short-subunit dehydrogenase